MGFSRCGGAWMESEIMTRRSSLTEVQRTYMANNDTVVRGWHVVDAKQQILGRLATEIATVLMGKHKPTYTPHVDTGDFVVVTNAEKIKVTGHKSETMSYARYSYHPGGLKVTSFKDMRQKHPDRIIQFAVKRMLPKNALGQRMLKKLKIYSGPVHPHAAQRPTAWDG